jgi:hypothetical protein
MIENRMVAITCGTTACCKLKHWLRASKQSCILVPLQRWRVQHRATDFQARINGQHGVPQSQSTDDQ